MNKKGFSLLEIVVTMGLMGVAAMFMMKLRTSQNKSLKTTENQAFILDTFHEIRAYLQKPGICKLTLGNNKIVKGLEIPAIVRHDGVEKYKVSKKLNGGNYIISKIWIEEFSYAPTNSDNTEFRGEAMLNVQFTKTNAESFGGASVVKSMELDLILDQNTKINDCAALGFLSIPNSIAAKDPDSASSVFEATIKSAQNITGKTLTQEQINKAVKDNKQLGEMMQMLKQVEEANKKAAKFLEE